MPSLDRTYLDLSRPIREFTVVVDLPQAGMRVDALLGAHFPWKSRTYYQRLLAGGDVLLDGRRAKPSARVKAGMRVVVKLPVDPDAPEQESADDLVFLYEDDVLAAIDKPSGMTVHPVGRIRHGTLINKLHARYRRPGEAGDIVPRLSHRLDTDTSGVVLIVKNRHVDAEVTEAFTFRRVRKTYLALIAGRPWADTGLVDAPIDKDPEGPTGLHMGVRADGQVARSRWRVRERYRRHALVELEPLTGRTHQLRVHMAHLGHAIVCDHLYGDLRPLLRSDGDPTVPGAEDGVILERLALHAHRLELDHPVTGERLVIESPLPPDLVAAAAALAHLAQPRRRDAEDRPC